MSTGNLELRLYGRTLCGSSKHDGNQAFHLIEELSKYLDANPQPNPIQYTMWFNQKSREILSSNHSKESIRRAHCEVIIDAERKLLMYNGGPGDKFDVSEDSIRNLEDRHNYQVLRYKHKNQL